MHWSNLLPRIRLSFFLLLALAAGLGSSRPTHAQQSTPQTVTDTQTSLGTAFTYQGRLTDNGAPANGTYDFQFALFNAPSSGSQVGNTLSKDDVLLNNGLFTVDLDFGNVFDGSALWLEIRVRPGNSTSAYTPLSPRQPLHPTPYALYADYAESTAWSNLTGIPAGFADGVDNDTTYTAGTGLTLNGTQLSLAGTYRLPQSCNSGQIAEWNGSQWACGNNAGNGDITAVNAGTGLSGGGTSGSVTLSLDVDYTDGRYWKLGGNPGTDPTTNFLGTADNQALELRVNNLRALRIEPTDNTPNLIGGLRDNSVVAGVVGATIAGGGAPDDGFGGPDHNRVTDNYGTVGGGYGNQVGDGAGTPSDRPSATVGGGSNNTASGSAATVGGGDSNTASSSFATVGGGVANNANGYAAAVGGGESNTANGSRATVGGGIANNASGANATVGGGQGNTVSGSRATVGGGQQNSVAGDYATVGGGIANNASGANATVGGGGYNQVIAAYGTIAGGGPSNTGDPANTSNRVLDEYGTVAGGGNNRAGSDDGNTTTAPYATVGGGQGNTASGSAATVSGGDSNTANSSGTTIGGGYNNTASSSYATVGGGYNNTANGTYATVGGGQTNTTSGSRATVGGGQQNSAAGNYATVGGGVANNANGFAAAVGGGQTNTASGNRATVGGGQQNSVAGDYATVGGGQQNSVAGNYATVGGGQDNTASGANATVGGGQNNSASGNRATVGGGGYNWVTAAYGTIAGGGPSDPSNPNATNNRIFDDYGTIAGGGGNRAGSGDGDPTDARYATVGGGRDNAASGFAATVGGGRDNGAGGLYATVPGGLDNSAGGNYSFAAGHRANANSAGCFVWGDSTNANVSCNTVNRTIFRSSGGFYIYTNSNLTTGARLSAGSGTWASLSDRNVKENIAPVDPQAVLEQVAQLPIATWNYKAQDASIRHMGPTAQDFYAAFGLGEEDTYIATVDADGVALAAIQGLYQQNQAQTARIAQLEAENADLRARMDALEERLSALEQGRPTSAVPGTLLPGASLLLLVGLFAWRQHRGGRR